jgi:glycosyltransferase involved in cell wall biosynthesis
MPHLKLLVTRRVIFPPSGALSRRLKYGRHVDRFIAISRAVRGALESAGVAGDKIEVIPSGLERNDILRAERDDRIRSEFGFENDFIIVTAGALTREKDFPTAIAAVRKIADHNPNVSLLILGDGPERESLEKLAGEILNAKIIFAGFREPLAPIFKACDLFLMTSTSEGLNTSAIEAAACGLPLVVSDVGGLPEIAENKINGILCRPGDSDTFARAVIDLMSDDDLRQSMARRSVEKSAAFDIDETAKKTMEVYNQLLETRR